MRQPQTSILLAAVLLVGLAGCGHNDQPFGLPSASASPSSSPAGATPATSAPTASAPATSAPARTTTATPAKAFPLTVTRRGGFAGVDDRVLITADGTAVVTRRGRPPVRSSLPTATMADLRQLLKAPELAGRAPRTEATVVCSDGYEYEIVSPTATTIVHDCDTPHGATLDRMLTIVGKLLEG
ncbi:hypothetical protein [Actinoplanes sp. NPDC049599]|uniref:hypothetical protein n=1 Tax=Actinoplanes sp. NPDC049599 TaxID=3363903 RepID=UPI00379F1500